MPNGRFRKPDDEPKRVERCARALDHGTAIADLYGRFTDAEIRKAQRLVAQWKREKNTEAKAEPIGRPTRVFVHRAAKMP